MGSMMPSGKPEGIYVYMDRQRRLWVVVLLPIGAFALCRKGVIQLAMT